MKKHLSLPPKNMKAKILFAAGVCGLISACSFPAGRQADELTMLAGTYTDKRSEGIYVFRFNQETGRAVPAGSVRADNPSFVIASADGKRVYAVHENCDSTDAVSAYDFDVSTGRLRLLDTRLSGEAPCHLSTNGKMLLAANYEGGSLSLFSLREDGSLEDSRSDFPGSASGVDSLRQATPHVHCSVFSPDGNKVIVSDFGGDRLMCFDVVEEGTGLQVSSSPVAVEPGSGPRHLTFSPDGKRLYLLNELSGKVVVYDYRDGRLIQKQTVEADKVHARGSADIHLSPDGKYLYASNRLKDDGIVIFAVDENDGTLTEVGYQLTGIHPRHFAITPNGKFLLVACRDDNRIQVFERDIKSGLLEDTRQDIPVSRAVCICFVPENIQLSTAATGCWLSTGRHAADSH